MKVSVYKGGVEEQVVPALLVKALEAGMRVVVRVGTSERAADISAGLWKWRGGSSFMPHGIEGETMHEEHPIWITSGKEVPQNTKVAMVLDKREAKAEEGFERVLVVGGEAEGLYPGATCHTLREGAWVEDA